MKRFHLRDWLSAFLDVPVEDPEDARRRKLLNIILTGVAALSLIMLAIIFMFADAPFMNISEQDRFILFGSIASILIGVALFYALNRLRRVPGWVGGFLFLVFLLVAIPFTDTPQELTNGRSLFVFVVPIVMASMLLRPIFSFIMAFLVSLELTFLSLYFVTDVNFIAIVGFFMIGIIAWLSARGTDQALRELRVVNIELDRRVEDRTRELSAALARELAEAGRSEAILQGIADGVAVFDTDGNSIVANPALSRLLGIPLADLNGVSMAAILQKSKCSPQESEAILSMLSNPHSGLPSARFHSSGRTMLVNAGQVFTGLGDSIGTVAVFRDFTREAEVEQMKNTFVGMVSHELRTPLNAIIGYAEMVREKVYGPITEHQSGIMARVENSGKRLLSLVSDLLDQAQIEAGKMKIHAEPLKVSGLTEALFALEKQVSDKGLTLTAQIDPAMPSQVIGDSRRLQQILINLVGNSVKFMSKGDIQVHIRPKDGEHWEIEVSDNGPGIPLEAQEFIFESFRQVEGMTTREHGGIGLGLAIVKSLVGLMGGEIKLWSEMGAGTRFNVILPYHSSQEAK